MEISEWKYNMLGRLESADDRLLKLMKALAEKHEVLDRRSIFAGKYNRIIGERRKQHLKNKKWPL